MLHLYRDNILILETVSIISAQKSDHALLMVITRPTLYDCCQRLPALALDLKFKVENNSSRGYTIRNMKMPWINYMGALSSLSVTLIP